MKTRYYLAWIFLFLNISLGVAQFGNTSGGASTPSQQAEVEPDTFNVQYFFQDNIDVLHSFSDTLLGNRFEQYDPTRRRDVDHAQLGNLGTAYYPQLFETRNHKGLDIGFHQYDIYKISYKDIPFYKVEKAFSDLFFTQGPTQLDTYFKGKFTRNFKNNLNLSVDFKRMNNDGQFKSQKAINTAFGIGLWFHHPNGKYDSFTSYTSNTNEVEDNGGIDREAIAIQPLIAERVFNIPVFLRTANTFHLSREYAYAHQYNLLGIADSSKQVAPKRKLVLSHDFIFKTNQYKFYDTQPPSDTIYYGEDLLVDTRGLRYLVKDNSLENTFAISTSKSGEEAQRDLLKVSLEHQIHFLNQEPNDSTINHFILGGQWNFAPSQRLKVNTNLEYNLFGNFGDYRLGGALFLDFKKAGTFKASLVNQLYSSSLIQRQMFISEQSVWKNDFDKTFENSISATYSLPQLRFSATGQYHIINNLIYFDTLAFPQQSGATINVFQLIINQDFKVWKFHLDNTLALQTTTDDVIRVPSVFSKHTLYFEGKAFRKKRMRLRIGLDLRLVKSYFANTYQPATGQFHLQDEQELELYPVTDVFASFKVKNFRLYVRGENLNKLIWDDLYYQVANYAQPYFTFKFGVSWQLLN